MMLDPTGIDAMYAPYLEHAARGEFALPRCADCGAFHFYPQPACPRCHSERVQWTPASGEASVYSFSVVHRAPDKRFAADVPYVVAIVATREGPHLMARIQGVDPDAVAIGMPVRVRLAGAGQDGVAMPVFEPAGEVR